MFGGVGRSARGLGAAVLIATAATFLRVAAPAPADAGQSGITYVSTGTWTVDPAKARIQVALQVTATSRTVDSGGRRYYFSGLVMTLPLSTASFAAADGKGQSMPVTVEATTPSGVVVDVGFRQRLYSGQTISFGLTFDVVDSGGSTDRDLRIGQDVVSFPVLAFGSPGTPGSSVSVIFPEGFTVQEQFGALVSSTDASGETVFSSGVVPDATALDAWFTASRAVPSAGYLTTDLTMGPISVELRYWADDPGWASQVGAILSSGYPMLRQLIGLGDPSLRSLTVEEVTTQGIGGFSGEFDPASGTVKVSYFADPVVVLHEAAHMWFNSDLASDRWIDEGFASYYAEQVVVALGLPDHSPVLSPQLLSDAVPLNDWTSAGVPGSATEAYLYGASLQAARDVAAIAGNDGLREVWALAAAHEPAYGGSAGQDSVVSVSGPADWQRLLDYLEQTTGQSFTAVWRRWVVTPSQALSLDERDVARAKYQAMQTLAGWDMPPDIRAAMGGWNFGSAEALLGQVPAIVTDRQQIAAAAPVEKTSPPTTLETAFETEGTAAALTEATRELSALSALASARRAQANNHSAAGAVGLLGTDPSAALAAARQAFASGDPDQATYLAESARAAWAGATGVGQIRIVGTAAGTAGVLLLLALFVWTRSGRRREDDRTQPPASTEARPDA
ncbi:MAG: hypothetical protein ABSA21_05910 [Candidatus Limnocylindrales bacterium]|jgi:hypothetical protein